MGNKSSYTNQYARARNASTNILLLEGSGTKLGDWYPCSIFSDFQFQTFAFSGTANSTWSGLIDIEVSLEDNEIATPGILTTLGSSGTKYITNRSNYVRARARNWSGGASSFYKVLLKMWDTDGNLMSS